MAEQGFTSLGAIRTLARQRADMVNSQFVTDSEFNDYISLSYYELYDLLVQQYGNNYFTAPPLSFQTDGINNQFPLPDGTLYSGAPAFFKLLGVDLALSNTLDSFVTIRPFTFGDRNRYAVPNFQSFYGVTNLRYRVHGNNLFFTPIPAGNQTIRVWYIPRLTNLQVTLYGTTTISNNVVTVSDTTGIANGMNVQGPPNGPIPSGTTISSFIPNTSLTLSQNATASSSNVILKAWSDATTVDGVSGWEEYVIVDAALKAGEKEETDVSVLAGEKMALIKRIEGASENRDAASPATVVDSQWSDFWWPTGNGYTGGGGAY